MEELVNAGYQNPNRGAFFEGFNSVIASVPMLREKEMGRVMSVRNLTITTDFRGVKQCSLETGASRMPLIQIDRAAAFRRARRLDKKKNRII